MRQTSTTILLILALLLVPRGPVAAPGPLSVEPGGGPPARLRSPLDHWLEGRARPFLSARIDVGFLYFRPRLSVGYGRPHARWAGLDVNPIISAEGAGAWAGLRGVVPYAELRLGARYFHSFRRSFLAPRETYGRDDIEVETGSAARHVSLETELSLDLPLGPGKVLTEGALTAVLGVPPGQHVFEETLRVVVDPPWLWRLRLGYEAPLDSGRVLWLGAIAEVVHVARRESWTVRGGLIARIRLYRNLEGRAALIPLWHSPDALGAAGTDLFLVGLRYRWATGSPWF